MVMGQRYEFVGLRLVLGLPVRVFLPRSPTVWKYEQGQDAVFSILMPFRSVYDPACRLHEAGAVGEVRIRSAEDIDRVIAILNGRKYYKVH